MRAFAGGRSTARRMTRCYRRSRFNAFLENPHDLDALLRERGIDTVIVAGAATNVCCQVHRAGRDDARLSLFHAA